MTCTNQRGITSKMKVMILAGGQGVRLKPLTYSIPKPLIPIGEKPIMEVLINLLKEQGFNDILVSIGYKSDLIESYFGDGKKYGVDIKYVREEKRMGTAGPLRIAKDTYNIEGSIMVINGDLLTKANLKEMAKLHENGDAAITVGVKEDEVQIKYGVYTIENKKIIGIKEKPIIKNMISVGINIFGPEVINMIPKDTYYDIPDLVNKALELKMNVSAFEIKEFWMAIDKLVDLEEADKIMREVKG